MTYTQSHHKNHLSHCLTPSSEPTPIPLLNLMTNGIVHQSSLPQCSTCLISNRTPCNILRQALYHIINLGLDNDPVISIPQKLTNKQYTGPVIEIEEYCNGVVHPVTKETITHYRELVDQGSPAQGAVAQGNEHRTPLLGTRRY
jgi:hypothetical protein